MTELHYAIVFQLLGELDGSSICLYLIRTEPEGCPRNEFAKKLFNYMISAGLTTDILSLAYGVDDPGRLTDIMIVVHPDCTISQEQVESRYQEFVSQAELALVHNVSYISNEGECTIVSMYTEERRT